MHIILEFIIFVIAGFMAGYIAVNNIFWGVIAAIIGFLIIYSFLSNHDHWLTEGLEVFRLVVYNFYIYRYIPWINTIH